MKVLAVDNGQKKQVNSVDSEPKFTLGNGVDLIYVDTTGVFWIAPFTGTITAWKIWTADESNKTIEIDVLKNGTTIGEDIDLSASDEASDTCSVAFVAGDKFSFNVDANTDAKKIIVQLLAEKS
jgi:hypothetical protein